MRDIRAECRSCFDHADFSAENIACGLSTECMKRGAGDGRTIIIILRRYIVCVCPGGRSPEVALTPRPWLAFRSTEKPRGVGDGRAESAWTTIANGLDVQLRGHARQR